MTDKHPQLNLNTLLTALVLAGLCYIGKTTISAKEDIIKIRSEQLHANDTLKAMMPRAEFDLRLKAVEVQLEAVKAQNAATEAELVKVKRLITTGKSL